MTASVGVLEPHPVEVHGAARLPQVDRASSGRAPRASPRARPRSSPARRRPTGTSCRTSPSPPPGRRSGGCRARRRAACRWASPPSMTRKPPTSSTIATVTLPMSTRPGIEDAEELDDAGVGVPVVLDVLAELLVVAPLLAEGLDRADARHRLDEVHDEARRGHARLPEQRLRAHLEPPRERDERDERDREHDAARRVEQHERGRREHHVEQARDELVEPRVEQLADGVEVARLARDDAARGVRLVELEARGAGCAGRRACADRAGWSG